MKTAKEIAKPFCDAIRADAGCYEGCECASASTGRLEAAVVAALHEAASIGDEMNRDAAVTWSACECPDLIREAISDG